MKPIKEAVGDELQRVIDCPHFSDVRAQSPWPVPRCCGVHVYFHVAQGPEVCLPLSHCLAAEAQTRTQSRPHKPGWLNGRCETLSRTQQMGVRQGCPLSPTLFGISLMGFMVTCSPVLQCQARSLDLAIGFRRWCMLMMSSCSPGHPQAFSSCWTA